MAPPIHRLGLGPPHQFRPNFLVTQFLGDPKPADIKPAVMGLTQETCHEATVFGMSANGQPLLLRNAAVKDRIVGEEAIHDHA